MSFATHLLQNTDSLQGNYFKINKNVVVRDLFDNDKGLIISGRRFGL